MCGSINYHHNSPHFFDSFSLINLRQNIKRLKVDKQAAELIHLLLMSRIVNFMKIDDLKIAILSLTFHNEVKNI